MKSKEVCVQLPTSADNASLLASAAERRAAAAAGSRCCRSVSPIRRPTAANPTAAASRGHQMGQTDRQTDGHHTVT